MSRHLKQLLVVTVATILVGGFTVRNMTWEPPPVPPVAEVQPGIMCFRQGGDHDYCSCLDRLETARAVAGRPTPTFNYLEHPATRYALRHHRLYPIITADTVRCVKLPAPRAPSVVAGTGVSPA